MNRFALLMIFIAISLLSCISNYNNIYNFNAKEEDSFNSIISKKDSLNNIIELGKWLNDLNRFFINNSKSSYYKELVGELLEKESNKEFKDYICFFLSNIYWEEGNKEVAGYYMLKVDKSNYSINYEEGNIGYFIAKRLITCDVNSNTKIIMYEILLNDYKEQCDVSAVLYELSGLYKKNYDIKSAVGIMKKLVDFYSKTENQNPEIDIDSIKNEIFFYNIKKDWVYRDLESLINNVEKAIVKKDYDELNQYVSKVNFYGKIFQKVQQTMTYKEIEIDKRWSRGIMFDDKPEGFSTNDEVFIKSKNWDFLYIDIWYFYFKKIDYPFDIDLNGSWEWAGIYFGSPY